MSTTLAARPRPVPAAISHTDELAFRFQPAELDRPRLPGISAMMRIRNGADFLRETIESHVAHYDEIVAVYNDCTDDTAAILEELAARYPGTVRPFHYQPRVAPPFSEEHDRLPTSSVHSLANYYNWTMARTRFSTVVKLDDDHLAIPHALADVVRTIRADIALGIRKLYTFSGINLVRTADGLRIYDNLPFVGTGDIMYFPVSSRITFEQAQGYERQVFTGPRLEKEYVGLLYFHLKHVKPDFGFGNFEAPTRERATAEFLDTLRVITFDEFRSAAYYRAQRAGYSRVEYWLRTNRVTQGIIFAVARQHAPLRVRRLQRMRADLAAIDWQADLLDRLRDLVPAEHGAGRANVDGLPDLVPPEHDAGRAGVDGVRDAAQAPAPAFRHRPSRAHSALA